MKKRIKKSLKTSNGITLIALVITIIVLLILAGISISMLSGDNSILQKATDAKTETRKGQEKEIVAHAYNSALTKKVSNGDSTAVTAEDMNSELINQGASAKGNSLTITVTFTDSKRQYLIKSNGIIEYAGFKSDEDSNIQIFANVRETESRAAVIEFKSGVKEWLKTLDSAELKKMWVKMENRENENNYEEYWNSHYSDYTDLKDYYENYSWEDYDDRDDCYYTRSMKEYYSDEYEMIIGENKADVSFSFDGETINGASAEFVVSKNGEYEINVMQGIVSGTVIVNVTKCLNRNDNQEEKYSTTAVTADTGKKSKTIKDKDNKDVEVPEGFYYGSSTNVGKIDTGFVITDSIDANTGYSNGNEFVWIPIDRINLNVKDTSKPIATAMTGATNGLPNYQGALYSEFAIDSTPNSNYVQSKTNNYREPAVTYNSGGVTDEMMQEDYNKMIQSVQKYGGFYIARYEMGREESYSKIGVMPTSSDEYDNGWAGLYNRAKSYSKSSVTAGMIWGSQYDAMLNFALLNSTDSSKVNANTNGNHTGDRMKTGIWLGASNQTDSMNNIFDLEGNMYEWTKEYGENNVYTIRGGGYTWDYPTKYRSTWGSKGSLNNTGSRISLYINV